MSLFISGFANADSHELNEILEKIQKDIKTLEKAVYSGSSISSNSRRGFPKGSSLSPKCCEKASL